MPSIQSLPDRPLPRNDDAERGLLGCILQAPEKLRAVATRIGPDSFSNELHGEVFSAAEHMVAAGAPVDIVTVTQWLKERSSVKHDQWPVLVTTLLNAAPSLTALEHFTDGVARAAAARQIATLAEHLRARVTELDAEPTDVVGYGIERLAEIGARAAGKPRDGLPEIQDSSDLLAERMELPQELVAGLIHQGTKTAIGGASKAAKSWSLLDLAFSVSHGMPWWGMTTKPGPVLYLNFEIGRQFFQKRIAKVVEAKGLPLLSGVMDIWNLRGYAADFETLLPKLQKRIKERGYVLIIIDPVYKGLGNASENSAEDMAKLCNAIEGLCVGTGAAVVFAAHFSKGNQSAKESIDRISGSGVFARDPDTILTLTKHAVEGCYTVEATLRNFPPLEPFVVHWAFPLFERTLDEDPKNLAAPGKKDTRPAPTVDAYVKLLPATWTKSKPRTGLVTATEMRAAMIAAKFDYRQEKAVRELAIRAGLAACVRGEGNTVLIGRPEAVKEWAKE